MANHENEPQIPWSKSDGRLTLAWCFVGMIARAPLVSRIEGVLDHDQSVVSLMALDIAQGRRLPIFFDGQRYMGAIESYVAAVFVRLVGHGPTTIALAPLVFYGLFVAGQYAVWRVWRDRTTGLMAAALTAVGSPMIALWGIVPRGGYVEFLAWGLPTMAVYRVVARPGRAKASPWRQAAWGFLLSVGYFINPLSLTIYVAIALDWMLARHGADLRRRRLKNVRWLDSRFAGLVWLVLAMGWVCALAFCCFVDPHEAGSELPYIAFGGWFQGAWTLPAGAIGVVLLLGAAGWWSNLPQRLYSRVVEQPWTVIGVLAAFLPFLVNSTLTRVGFLPASPTLPVWISAPWRSAENVRTAVSALGPLLGSDPHVAETVLIGQGVDPPVLRWESLANALTSASPFVVATILVMLVAAVIRDRVFWRKFVSLRCEDVAPPSAFAMAGLAVCVGMFMLQGTSPNVSSVRYLVPVWVTLPGLIACGLQVLPRKPAAVGLVVLVVPWCACQFSLWNDLDRQASARPLAEELGRRGVKAIVAPTPVALIVANLSHGEVGAVEFKPMWPRLRDRYASRFSVGHPLTCVVDRRFPWTIHGRGGWAPEQDLGRHLLSLSAKHPGRVNKSGQVGPYEIWDIDLPINLVLGTLIDRERLAARP